MIDDLLQTLPAVRLEDLPIEADLQRRFDAKYVVPLTLLADLVVGLGPDMEVLDVEGRRSTDYRSVYFDTADLLAFTDHLKQRRRRFKIRTRRYDDAAPVLEVKYKGAREQTVKARFPHTGAAPDEIDVDGLALAREALVGNYPAELPDGLRPVLVTRYRRSTLVDGRAAERVTIDRGLQVVDLLAGEPAPVVDLGATHAIIEVKSLHRAGRAHRVMRAYGQRPDRLSKYCLGVTATGRHARGNPWLPVLRKLTGDAPGSEVSGSGVSGGAAPGSEVSGSEVSGSGVSGGAAPGSEASGSEVSGSEVSDSGVSGGAASGRGRTSAA